MPGGIAPASYVVPQGRAARSGDETTRKIGVWHDLAMRRVETLPAWLRAVRSGFWLGAGRVRGYAAILLAIELAAFTFFAAVTQGWSAGGDPDRRGAIVER